MTERTPLPLPYGRPRDAFDAYVAMENVLVRCSWLKPSACQLLIDWLKHLREEVEGDNWEAHDAALVRTFITYAQCKREDALAYERKYPFHQGDHTMTRRYYVYINQLRTEQCRTWCPIRANSPEEAIALARSMWEDSATLANGSPVFTDFEPGEPEGDLHFHATKAAQETTP